MSTEVLTNYDDYIRVNPTREATRQKVLEYYHNEFPSTKAITTELLFDILSLLPFTIIPIMDSACKVIQDGPVQKPRRPRHHAPGFGETVDITNIGYGGNTKKKRRLKSRKTNKHKSRKTNKHKSRATKIKRFTRYNKPKTYIGF